MLLVQQIHDHSRAVNMDVLALICRQLLINGFPSHRNVEYQVCDKVLGIYRH